MKSGRAIYQKLVRGCGDETAIRALPNGDLRSLIRYMDKHEYYRCDDGGLLYGMATVEAATRWMAKGKGKGL